jgi:hypothetical protein
MTSLTVSRVTTPRPPTIIAMARAAFAEPGVEAAAATTLALVRGYCTTPLPRIPGCDTLIRLGIRIHLGMSVERAAAREYAYRWHLFLDAWINHSETRARSRFAHGPVIYPAPHPLGL